jgi:hypothetical protein
MFSARSKKLCQGFVKTSPLAKKEIGKLQLAAITSASKNESGWLATINTGPFWKSAFLLCTLMDTQNILSAMRIKKSKIWYSKPVFFVK